MSPSKGRANEVKRTPATIDIVLFRSPATSPVATGGFGEFSSPNKAPSPQIETWNTTNQWSFCQFLNVKPPWTNAKPHRRNAKLSGDASACNMNVKGQTRNENIWTVTRYKEKSPSQQLSEVGPALWWWHKYTKQASSHSQIWIVIEESRACALESPLDCWKHQEHSLINRQKWHSIDTSLEHIQNHNFSTSWTQDYHDWMFILQRH